MADSVLPVVDLAAFRSGGPETRTQIARDVDAACQDTGFLVLEGHGVDDGVIRAAWAAADRFFDLPLRTKLTLAPDRPDGPRGYFPVERETLTRSRGVAGPPDFKEAFSLGPPSAPDHAAGADREFFYGANRWPDDPTFRNALTTYYAAMVALAAELMSLFAAALTLPQDYFAGYFTHHSSALRLLNYPARAPSEATRAGAHSDYGSLTILRSDPKTAGLEVETSAGRFVPAPRTDSGFIVNIGDLMARWTNDRWTSTVHRVVAPEGGERRQSIAFFHNPNFDADIDCLPVCIEPGDRARHARVSAGRYLRERFTSALPDA